MRMPSTSELIELHAQTMFVHDADGRLLAINESRRERPPRFFAAWSADAGAIWRVRGDVPAALVARIGEVFEALPREMSPEQPLLCAPEVRAILAEQSSVGDEEGGPAYLVPEGVAAEAAGAEVVMATPANASILARWLSDWHTDVSIGLPVAATLVDGAAVAICACARLPGVATEAGLETHKAFRGRGYAGPAVAAWAEAISCARRAAAVQHELGECGVAAGGREAGADSLRCVAQHRVTASRAVWLPTAG